MKNNRPVKYALLVLLALAFCLLLTGCYIAPDDINDTDASSTNNQPFETLAPTATVTVSTTPETIVVTQNIYAPNTIALATPSLPPQSTSGWPDWGTVPTSPAYPMSQTSTPPASQVTAHQTGGTVILVTATPNTSAVTSKPGSSTSSPIKTVTKAPASATKQPSSLQLGMNGDAVRSLQKNLKQLGYYNGSVDGDYGVGTESAVKAFQKANGLTADGKAGSNTISKISSGSAVSAKQSGYTIPPASKTTATSKPTAKITATPRPTATPNLTREYYLTTGSKGDKVKTLQNRLISLGWLQGKATGSYDAPTITAVKAFQKKVNIWDDGIAGPDTLKTLYSNSAPKATVAAAVTGDTLSFGSEGLAVRALQKRLKELGYLKDSVDGSYGDATVVAVSQFQQNNNLNPDGKAGQNTLNILFSDDAAKAGESSATVYTTLRQGSKGDKVTNLQERLIELGYFSGSATGSYGSSTADAVKAFQNRNGLTPADGIAGSATQQKLYSKSAIPASGKPTYSTLRPGDTGEAVVEMQYALKGKGYLSEITATYDEATRQAVIAFQRANGLTADGIAGASTLERLYA